MRDQGSSASPPREDITFAIDCGDALDWRVIENPGLSPMCTICQSAIDLFGPGSTPSDSGEKYLTTTVSFAERSQAGCSLCTILDPSFKDSERNAVFDQYGYLLSGLVFYASMDRVHRTRIVGNSRMFFRNPEFEVDHPNAMYVNRLGNN